MSTTVLTAPAQDSAAAWHGIRLGRFTASTIGELMSEPKSLDEATIIEHGHLVPDDIAWKVLQSGPRKGQRVRVDGFGELLRAEMRKAGLPLFGSTAMECIAKKAAERLNHMPSPCAITRSMERGMLLEHPARILLSRYWKHIDTTTFQMFGDNSGATPDGLIAVDDSSWNVKCPEEPGDLLLFADSVADGDFEALERWNKKYAWQTQLEALASGTDHATITLFTDRIPKHQISDEERREMQDIMNAVAYQLGEVYNRPFSYNYETNGFAFVSRRFELTNERVTRIRNVIRAAEKECVRLMALMS